MERRSLSLLAALALSFAPLGAWADDGVHDRVAFGSDVHVGPNEVVRDAISFGGHTLVEGEVRGDAVSFGGDVELRESSRVRGDVTSFGGEVRDHSNAGAHHARAHRARHVSHAHHEPGALESFWHWVKETARNLMAHVLLFLLGLFMIGVTRDRLGAMQATMIKDGVRTAGQGLIAYIVAVVALVLLTITIIGIPGAIVIGIALPVATYVGLAAAATVLGAALPFPQLKGREVLQLAAGVGVLFLVSLLPGIGGIFTAAAACLGVGALVRTRGAPVPPRDLPTENGPYRTPAPV